MQFKSDCSGNAVPWVFAQIKCGVIHRMFTKLSRCLGVTHVKFQGDDGTCACACSLSQNRCWALRLRFTIWHSAFWPRSCHICWDPAVHPGQCSNICTLIRAPSELKINFLCVTVRFWFSAWHEPQFTVLISLKYAADVTRQQSKRCCLYFLSFLDILIFLQADFLCHWDQMCLSPNFIVYVPVVVWTAEVLLTGGRGGFSYL